MLNLTRTADYLAANVQQMGFLLMSKTGGEGLPLVAWRLNPEHNHKFDEFAIAHQLRERGWVVPAYTMAPHSESLKMMRVVVREDFSRSRCDALIADLKLAVQELSKMDEQRLEQHTEHLKAHGSRTGRHKGMNQHFTDEKHSLRGKHGKTHAVC
jgi:glutamate decarboxylase